MHDRDPSQPANGNAQQPQHVDAAELDNVEPRQLSSKRPFLQSYMPLFFAAVVLSLGFLSLGYTVGKRQGLTVVGFDADAQELAEVVTKQKTMLNDVNTSLNSAVQERDIAIANFNDVYDALAEARSEKMQFDSMNVFYREILRRRGGVAFTVQNLSFKPLPENAFEYQINLIQISPTKATAAGQIEIRLIRGGEVLQVPMQTKDFSFKDYARLTGRWTMPNGFVPQFVELHISQGTSPMVKRYRWQKGAKIDSSSNFVTEIPQAAENAQ